MRSSEATHAEPGRAVYQSFAEVGGPAHGAERVARLRGELKALGLNGFVVPRADEHQNEYVPANAERLMWLTGFSGSAGFAVVLQMEAALFVDGRYWVQAGAQVDGAIFTVRHIVDEPPSAWLAARLNAHDRIGYDPWLLTQETAKRLEDACRERGAAFVAVEANPVDALWQDRPPPPQGKVTPRPAKLAGETTAHKLERTRAAFKDVDGALVSDPHNVAWLFNIRGADVSHTPLPLAFAFVSREGRAKIFIDPAKLTAPAAKALASHADIEAPDALIDSLQALGAGKRIAFDAATAPVRLVQALEAASGKASVGADPVTLLKASKNAAELEGTREAHRIDAVALARFLAWFDERAPSGSLTEIEAAVALERFRRETGALKDISFPTISAAGAHAAMPHYRVSEASNVKIRGGFYLVDSGGQYELGTTDITRTIVVGRLSSEMRDRFTRVLKGHIAIATALFPKGTTGAQLDSFARKALWDAGLDYDHGTGHGVGVYLSVHEGPQRIAKTGTVALAAGMIVSNEPGYYAPGRYGIRTENLVVVEARETPKAERPMMGFETISLAPIDLRGVEARLLSQPEVDWLNAYHARVLKEIAPLLDPKTRAWLRKAARRLKVV